MNLKTLIGGKMYNTHFYEATGSKVSDEIKRFVIF